jgi:hypothetical protein
MPDLTFDRRAINQYMDYMEAERSLRTSEPAREFNNHLPIHHIISLRLESAMVQRFKSETNKHFNKGAIPKSRLNHWYTEDYSPDEASEAYERTWGRVDQRIRVSSTRYIRGKDYIANVTDWLPFQRSTTLKGRLDAITGFLPQYLES